MKPKFTQHFVIAAALMLALNTASAANQESVSPAKLKAEIESLRPTKLVWREIDWKYCLLEGIEASRQQKKPILLWAFINSDPASERC